jgi:hypothetical protein
MGKTFLMLGRDNFVQKEKVSQKMELFSMSERRIFPFWKESLSQDFPRAIYYPSLEWLPGWTGTPGNSAEYKKRNSMEWLPGWTGTPGNSAEYKKRNSVEWLPGWTGTPGNSAEYKKKKLCENIFSNSSNALKGHYI